MCKYKKVRGNEQKQIKEIMSLKDYVCNGMKAINDMPNLPDARVDKTFSPADIIHLHNLF